MRNLKCNLSELIDEERIKLNKAYNDKFIKELEVLEIFFDQLNTFARIIDLLLYGREGIDLLGSSIMKSFSTLFSSFTLEREGHFGSSRILLRHVYEYLIIGKYYSVTSDCSILKKWRRENENRRNYISISKLIKTINNIDTKFLLSFWSDLCEYTHATIYSQQIGYSFEAYKKDHALNQGFIIILLDMMYHYMHSHFVNHQFKSAYLLNNGKNEWNNYLASRNKQKKLIKGLKTFLGPEGRSLCYHYKRKWFK